MNEPLKSEQFRIEVELGAFSNLSPLIIAQHISIAVRVRNGAETTYRSAESFFETVRTEAVSVTLNHDPNDKIPFYLVKVAFKVETKTDAEVIERVTEILFGDLTPNLTDDTETLLIRQADYLSFEVTPGWAK